MTVYAVGGEAECFSLVAGSTYVVEATSGRFESTLSRNALLVTNGLSEVELPFGTALTSAWIHMRLYQEAVTAGNSYISLRNADGTETEYRIDIDASGFWTVSRFKSATFTALATTSAAVCVNEAADIDIFYNRAISGGQFQIYKNGVSLMSFTGDTDTTSPVARIRFSGLTTNSREMNISQVIVTNESTIGWKLSTLNVDAAGANSAWTGTFADVDEANYDAGDFIRTTTVGNITTLNTVDINAAFSTFNVKAVVVAGRGSNDAGSPVADIQTAVRSGGTNYFTANLGFPKTGADNSVQTVYETNPATSAAWSQAEANAVEVGYRAS